ncbi:MAG: hypothetical protein JWQ24_1309 [Tardiphaga sp.]|nr:hypothetical protein [Tardiphaga sp.]
MSGQSRKHQGRAGYAYASECGKGRLPRAPGTTVEEGQSCEANEAQASEYQSQLISHFPPSRVSFSILKADDDRRFHRASTMLKSLVNKRLREFA